MKKKVHIIGGYSAIGFSTASVFAKNGFDIELSGKNKSKLVNKKAILEKSFSKTINTYTLNIENKQSIDHFLKSLQNTPDILVISTGYYTKQSEKIDSEYIKKNIKINFEGPIIIINKLIQSFKARGSGTIICICSAAGIRGRANNYIYGSSKAGLINYLSGIRNYLARFNINVITVNPGYIKTPMLDKQLHNHFLTISPDELANEIFKSYIRKKDIIYGSYVWLIIALIIRIIPEKIFKKLNL